MFGYNENLFQYSYNLEQAVTYWNAAMNNDALDDILANNSYRIILYYNSGNELRRKIQLLLKDGILDMLDTEGCIQPSQQLSIEVQGIGWSTYLQSAVNGRIGCCVFDLEPDYADPDNCVYPYVHTEGTYGSWAKIGEALGWNGDQVDGWIEEAGDSQNEDERISIYDDIQEAVVEFAAYVWVCQKTIFHVEHAELNGYQYNPMYDSYFYHYCKGSICSTTTTTPYDSEDMMIVVIIAATVGGIVGSIITLVVVIFIKRRT
jgi:peptide/nickel transport system substrate-binding protein